MTLRGSFRRGPVLGLALLLVGLAERQATGQVMALPDSPISPSREAREEAVRQAIWAPLGAATLARTGGTDFAPGAPRQSLRLDPEALLRVLDRAPMEQNGVAAPQVTLSLPMPDGTYARFAIEESPILAPVLAVKYPEIRTFRGRGIEDRSASARLDWTPHGFHAIIFSTAGTVYIDPPSPGDRVSSVAYFRRDARRRDAPAPRCLPRPERSAAPHLRPAGEARRLSEAASLDANLRTFRLAVAATGEYTEFSGGSVGSALAEITTTINRVDGIYERELAVRFVLVGKEEAVIFTDPSTDPYSNGNAPSMETQNQATLDAAIGSADYDIGHVFGTSGGGFADAGVCVAGQKGKGVSAISPPSGDPFDVDFVAHEIGHQFGAIHTFNGTTGFCLGGRDAGSAYEPASGSTIMAYAGICGAEDLQSHTDDYFHWKSLAEIEAFLASTTCASQTPTGNSAPVVLAGADYTVPSETPFELAGNATDPDGDLLTYAWEEADLGAASPPSTDNGDRPIFRSFPPTGARFRTFPRLSDVLSGVATFGESLPTTTRALSFRLTARDNRPNGGAASSDGMQVQVRGDSGPFAVTQPNTAVSWPTGSTQTVLWNVANTVSAPVSAARVRIRLSVNGGVTFPYVLAQNADNDGSQSVILPTLVTGSARVKVEAVGNVFFDVSDSDFSVTPGTPVVVSAVAPSSGPAAGGTSVTISGSGFVSGATVKFGGTPATAVQFVGSTQLIATAPPRPAGSLQDVAVRNPSAQTGTLQKAWLADFLDVPQAHNFHDFIARIFRFGITAGCGSGNFCPAASVTRAQMAVFLLIAEHGPGYVPPPATGIFSDVPPGAFAAAFIEQLANEGITAGCGGGQYCPNGPVTREQMAVFLLAAEHGGFSGFYPPAAVGLFSDVPTSSGFAPWIEQLFAEGVTSGCGAGNYCPGSSITRGQMAVFLVTTFDLP